MGGGFNGEVLHNVFDRVVSLKNLFSAWREFKRGKRRRPDVQEFEFSLEDNLFQLHGELKSKTYEHGSYTPFYVTDPKLRRIHKASVRDRILHQAVFRVLYHIFDKSFIFDSYSCRLNKGTHKAVTRLETFCRKLSQNNSKNIFALKCDIKKFFDSVDQDILMGLISRKIGDAEAMRLIEKIVKSFSQGLPLGSVTSQLFANIYLNELDQFVKHKLKERYYIRYCDDFVILGDNFRHLLGLSETINDFLNNHLKLSLHPKKIVLRKHRQGIDFLGYVVLPRHRVLRTRTKRRLLRRINEKNRASYSGILKYCKGFKIEQVIERKIYKP
ncbi:MAG: RNA-dependent DNA polymerase [Parcubacteria group bacterium]|nr:RNA-dependent DNA polymerase [Parcubacteria group bacterium]